MCYVWVPYVIAALGAGGSMYVQNQNNKKMQQAIEEQVNTQATQEMDQRAREARAERARIRVAAAESGIQGASFESSLAQSLFNEANDTTKIKNLAEKNQLAQKSQYPISNATGYALAIGSSLASTYASRGSSANTGVQIKQ